MRPSIKWCTVHQKICWMSENTEHMVNKIMHWKGSCYFTSSWIFFAASCLSLITRNSANSNIKNPWPTSPNMMANRNGNVMMVYGAEKNKCDNFWSSSEHPQIFTWINLPVASDTISIHNILETAGELVGTLVCWWIFIAFHAIQNWRYCATTLFLKYQAQSKKVAFKIAALN